MIYKYFKPWFWLEWNVKGCLSVGRVRPVHLCETTLQNYEELEIKPNIEIFSKVFAIVNVSGLALIIIVWQIRWLRVCAAEPGNLEFGLWNPQGRRKLAPTIFL